MLIVLWVPGLLVVWWVPDLSSTYDIKWNLIIEEILYCAYKKDYAIQHKLPMTVQYTD